MRRRKNPPGINEYVTRHGTTVYYLRRPGCKKVRLAIPKGVLPWSPSFMSIYEAALAGMSSTIGDARTVLGTVSAALVGYYESVHYTKGLAKVTQQNRRAILEAFRREHGDKRISLMHANALQSIMNHKSPASQRNFKRAMRGFIDFCIGHNMIKVDPLLGTKLSKMKSTGGHHTWTNEEVTQYQACHSTGTQARLALELLLNTGHARGDVVRMGPQHVRNGTLSMRRQKTNVAFDIPLLPDLIAELSRHTISNMAFLVSERGTPFGSASFGNKFRSWCYQANLPHCSAHGLRKASAVRHALNGATAFELMAWHGWKTIGEAQRYVEEANRIKLAASAGAKMRTSIDPLSNSVGQNNV